MADLTRAKKSYIRYYLDKYYVLVLIIVFILILILVGNFVLKPKYNKVRYGGSSNLKTHLELINTQKNYITSLKKLKSNFSNINKKEVEKLLDILPSQKDIPGLFVQLEDIAQGQNLTLTSIDIAEEEGITIIGSESGGKTTAPEIKKLKININLQDSSYQSLKDFLTSVENNLRLFDIVSLTFGQNVSSFDLNLITYYLISDEGY